VVSSHLVGKETGSEFVQNHPVDGPPIKMFRMKMMKGGKGLQHTMERVHITFIK
jgi:hypothetical protein